MPDFREEHNGWHAYRHVLSDVGMTSDLYWYARPDESTHYLTNGDRRQRILNTIEKQYDIQLTDEDTQFVLTMTTPRQMCVDFPNRFSPRHYPALTSDYPRQQKGN